MKVPRSASENTGRNSFDALDVAISSNSFSPRDAQFSKVFRSIICGTFWTLPIFSPTAAATVFAELGERIASASNRKKEKYSTLPKDTVGVWSGIHPTVGTALGTSGMMLTISDRIM
eukprot:12641809-Ditylum_brightwellii.AAC.1